MYDTPLSVPSIIGNEWLYVKECLDTEWVSSSGKFVNEFEKMIAEYVGARYAVSCINGTAALQVSLRLVGVQPDDEVIVPTLTFIAPVNAITYNGATPIFMDADKHYNIDSDKTIEFIKRETIFKDGFTFNKTTNNRISAIMPVHVWGNAAFLDELVPLCEQRNIAVVEDASESMGTFYKNGRYKGRHTGIIGKLGCLSFNGNKIITTGGGGMILTNIQKMADEARYLTTQAKDDSKRYIHNEIGYNFRLTNIQAALGLAQLEQLQFFLDNKRVIFNRYQTAVENIVGLRLAGVPTFANNNHWMNILQIEHEAYGNNLEFVMQRLEANSIQTRPVWQLNHLQKPYIDCQSYKIEKAKQLVTNSISLPSSASLTNDEINNIITQLENK